MKPAEQYEYIHGQVTRAGYVILDGETEERSFNDMGAQGWMLYPPNGTVAYFYRVIPTQIETKITPYINGDMIDMKQLSERLGLREKLSSPAVAKDEPLPEGWERVDVGAFLSGAITESAQEAGVLPKPDKAVDFPPANPRLGSRSQMPPKPRSRR